MKKFWSHFCYGVEFITFLLKCSRGKYYKTIDLNRYKTKYHRGFSLKIPQVIEPIKSSLVCADNQIFITLIYSIFLEFVFLNKCVSLIFSSHFGLCCSNKILFDVGYMYEQWIHHALASLTQCLTKFQFKLLGLYPGTFKVQVNSEHGSEKAPIYF